MSTAVPGRCSPRRVGLLASPYLARLTLTRARPRGRSGGGGAPGHARTGSRSPRSGAVVLGALAGVAAHVDRAAARLRLPRPRRCDRSSSSTSSTTGCPTGWCRRRRRRGGAARAGRRGARQLAPVGARGRGRGGGVRRAVRARLHLAAVVRLRRRQARRRARRVPRLVRLGHVYYGIFAGFLLGALLAVGAAGHRGGRAGRPRSPFGPMLIARARCSCSPSTWCRPCADHVATVRTVDAMTTADASRPHPLRPLRRHRRPGQAHGAARVLPAGQGGAAARRTGCWSATAAATSRTRTSASTSHEVLTEIGETLDDGAVGRVRRAAALRRRRLRQGRPGQPARRPRRGARARSARTPSSCTTSPSRRSRSPG